MDDPRRRIAGTDRLLAEPVLVKAVEALGRSIVKSAVVQAQERARSGEIAPENICQDVLARLPATATSLTPVLNATGILVHTNLGRAALSRAAVDAVTMASAATDLEFDLLSGGRGRRGRGAMDALLDVVPQAAAAHVVTNNAAALLLCALALAPGKEIVISRGELVEIGDGFRIPELLESAGARLREVGTTNRTSPQDYADAIGPDTAFVLKVHPSNFRVTGFVAGAAVADLAALGVPVIADIGSGLLQPHPTLPDEPDAATTLDDGAALVTASADKLLGGPQAGLMLGDVALVERLRRHPAARAMRVGKMTLAALEATLRGPLPPVGESLLADPDHLYSRAAHVAAALANDGIDALAVRSVAAVGGGGAPGVDLPSAAVSLPARYGVALRRGSPPVVGRVERDRCLLDLRALPTDEDQRLIEAVRRCK